MNLTEVLLAVIVSLAVLAGGYTLYNSVSDKNAVSATMQNLSLLRANIDDLYAGNYAGLASDAADGTLHKTGVLPDALADLSDGGKPATKWGAIDIEGTDDGAGYTIAFEGLGKDVCMHLGRSSTAPGPRSRPARPPSGPAAPTPLSMPAPWPPRARTAT